MTGDAHRRRTLGLVASGLFVGLWVTFFDLRADGRVHFHWPDPIEAAAVAVAWVVLWYALDVLLNQGRTRGRP